MAKQLLIEQCEFLVSLGKTELTEAVTLAPGDADTLIVKNIPMTILNRENQNGRIYRTTTVQEAIKNAKPAMLARQTYGQGDEHPEGSFVAPTHASHVVIDAYIKNVQIIVEGQKIKQDVLFGDWLILNTQEGKNLRALFEARCSVGTSIRSLGDMNGKYVVDLEYLSTDCVGNPSSGTFSNMVVNESVKAQYVNNKKLAENFEVVSTSENSVQDINAAAQLQTKLNDIDYGKLSKSELDVSSESDPKSGAVSTVTILSSDAKAEVTTIDQALVLAKKALTNPTFNVTMVSIEKLEDDTETNESVKKEEMEVDGNTLTADLGDGTEIEKKFDSDKDANLFASIAQTDPEAIKTEDTEKQNGKWVNKGAEGTHGTFATKKAADSQRAAMFANGYHEDGGETTNCNKVIYSVKTGQRSCDGIDMNDKEALRAAGKISQDAPKFAAAKDEATTTCDKIDYNYKTGARSCDGIDMNDKDALMAAGKITQDEPKFAGVKDEANEQFVLQVQGGPYKNYYVMGDGAEWSVTPDVNQAKKFGDQIEAEKFRKRYSATEYDYDDATSALIIAKQVANKQTPEIENVYSGKTNPSDQFVQAPITDATNDGEIRVTVKDIAYDVDESTFTEEDVDLINELPSSMTKNFKKSEIPEQGADQFILNQIAKDTGLPVASIVIDRVDEA